MATVNSDSITIYNYRTANYYNKINGHIRWTYNTNTSSLTTFSVVISKVDFIVESQSTGQWNSSMTDAQKNQFKTTRFVIGPFTFLGAVENGTNSIGISSTSSSSTTVIPATGINSGDVYTLFSGTRSSTGTKPINSALTSTLTLKTTISSSSSTTITSKTVTSTTTFDIPIRNQSRFVFYNNHPSASSTSSIKYYLFGESVSPIKMIDSTNEYKLKGWFSESTCENQVEFPLVSLPWPGETELYAGWVKNTGARFLYKQEDQWKNCDVYVKVNNQWKRCSQAFIKIDNTWKEIL